jgi:hypothetical protein
VNDAIESGAIDLGSLPSGEITPEQKAYFAYKKHTTLIHGLTQLDPEEVALSIEVDAPTDLDHDINLFGGQAEWLTRFTEALKKRRRGKFTVIKGAINEA